jgi:hypothetical protein
MAYSGVIPSPTSSYAFKFFAATGGNANSAAVAASFRSTTKLSEVIQVEIQKRI